MKLSFALFIMMVLCPALAAAQVKVNQAALRQLAGIELPAPEKAAPPRPRPRPAVHHHRVIYHHHVTVAVVKAKPVPVVARVTPAPLPVAKPVAKPPSPALLKFATGSATLPANAALAIKPFCSSKAPVGIAARAPGDASDPSAAMRLSLSRAMALRDALVACGVPPAEIIPRALGTVPGQNEDEAVLGATK